jgi:hypothetical protein
MFKKATILILLLNVAMAACAHLVRDDDLNAWKGVPLIELETHPFFSSLPLEKRPLSNGQELWIYSNTEAHADGECSDGDCQAKIKTKGCLNQFMVSGGQVLEYRPIPLHIISCVTTCKTRPASRPCS